MEQLIQTMAWVLLLWGIFALPCLLCWLGAQSGIWRETDRGKQSMKPVVKTYLNAKDGQPFWGYGPVQLLKKTNEIGSLRGAALELGMSYSKAMKLLKRAEAGFGFPLLQRTTGGVGGGGSALTAEAQQAIDAYDRFRAQVSLAAEKAFEQEFGCYKEEESGKGM